MAKSNTAKSKRKSRGSGGAKGGGLRRITPGGKRRVRKDQVPRPPTLLKRRSTKLQHSFLVGARLLARMGKDTSQCTTRSS